VRRYTYPLSALVLTVIAPVALAHQGIGETPAKQTAQTQSAPAIPPVAITAPVTLPFSLRAGHIFVDATLNGQAAQFVLDSGAGANIISSASAKRFHLKKASDSVFAVGASGSEPAWQTRIQRVDVGAASLQDCPAFIVSLPSELEADGLLGYDFLSRFRVTLDYEHSLLTLAPPTSTTELPAGSAVLPMRLRNNVPTIEALVDGKRGRFQVDTGAGNGLTLFRAFVDKHHLRDRYPERILSVGKSAGGLVYSDEVRLREFSLGSSKFTGIPADFSTALVGVFSDPGLDGNLGADVLRRFTLTLDYSKSRIVLAPNHNFAEPFAINRSGIYVSRDDSRYTVIAVIPDSPAAVAGIAKGDALLEVDGVPVADLHTDDLYKTFHQPAGKTIRVVIQSHDAARRSLTLTLRDLL